jgi:sigma-B regulation protein RsbU (phosphoserine phosphatase)
MAAIAARAAIVPWVLFSQPLSSMRESALGLFTLGAAALAASVYWALRGAEPDAQATAASFSPEAEAPAKPDRERLKAEFEVARKAQQDALPADPPVMEGYSLAGWCEPAQQVGGDLYDFFPLPDGRLGIAVADVSGKGVPAALYMMVTKGLLTAVSRDSNQLAYILEQINLHLYRACRKKVFVTMAAVVLDSSNRRLEYGRAGHNPVVWRRTRRGQTALVKPPGLGLGMTPGERFTRSLRIEELELEPQDAIVLYSDGVTEAVNHAMEQFGEARLMRAVESTDGQSAIDSRDAILRDLAEFRGAAPARDDITLVVIRA